MPKHLVALLKAAQDAVKGVEEVDAAISILRINAGVVRGYHELITEWVPAVIALGWSVRECHWGSRQAGTGDFARRLIMACLHCVMLLSAGRERSVKYIRTMLLALATWTPWHSHLAAAAYSEELCEARLSKLAAEIRRVRGVEGVDDILDVYLCNTPERSGRFALRPTRVSREFVETADRHILALIANEGRGVTRVQWFGTARKAMAQADWDDRTVRWPAVPTQACDQQLVHDLTYNFVLKLMVGDEPTAETEEVLRAVGVRKTSERNSRTRRERNAAAVAAMAPHGWRQRLRAHEDRHAVDWRTPPAPMLPPPPRQPKPAAPRPPQGGSVLVHRRMAGQWRSVLNDDGTITAHRQPPAGLLSQDPH